MNQTLTRVVTAAVLLAAAAGLRADSIWIKANGRVRPLHSDDVAKNVGDNLTIVVNEQNNFENNTNRDAEKQTNRVGTMGGTVALGSISAAHGTKAYNIPTVNVTGASDNKFQGNSDFKSTRTLTDEITVVVEDVLPNGNMVVLGKRERDLDGDKQVILISGMVRPSDVAFDNTIPSEKVANFQIAMKIHGPEHQFNTPGWFGSLLNWLSPS